MTVRKKLFSSLLLATLAFSTGLLLNNSTKASSSVKVIWRQKMNHFTYQINQSKAKKAYAYSAKLGKKVFKLSNYKQQSFVTYYHQKLNVRGKYRIYYYVKSTSGKKVAGWVWRGYLTKLPTKSMDIKSEIGATVNSKNQLMSYINASPDLDPDLTILGFETDVYAKYKTLLSQQYNLAQFASTGVFENHHATIYVADSRLTDDVNTAITRWNKALGKDVFSIGSATNHTLTVKFTDASDKQWDGLFNGDTIEINQNRFTNPNYASNNLATSSVLEAKLDNISSQASDLLDLTNSLLTKLRTNYQLQYMALKNKYDNASSSTTKANIEKQISDLTTNYETQDKTIRSNYDSLISSLRQAVKNAYIEEQPSISQASTTNYWTTVIMHEMGHGLGLYHTPYQSDVMFASSSTEQDPDATPSPVKYTWTQSKDPSDARAYISATLTSRDVDRAKLAGLLGYW
ncbi:matrixin family metalloprotease [Lentilactobacillus raoultii]|uniref:Matrixin family metalloprotease n=1 Tax=Lentilactobacillus raoultii TaxID=1987503 RepID=A0ABW3PMC1_9LACO|nr:matrixin family metalloprotease [Lentilactobacillus raoultii]